MNIFGIPKRGAIKKIAQIYSTSQHGSKLQQYLNELQNNKQTCLSPQNMSINITVLEVLTVGLVNGKTETWPACFCRQSVCPLSVKDTVSGPNIFTQNISNPLIDTADGHRHRYFRLQPLLLLCCYSFVYLSVLSAFFASEAINSSSVSPSGSREAAHLCAC